MAISKMSNMSHDQVLIDIIDCCRSMDEKAFVSYRAISQLSQQDGLSEFWRDRAQEEESHLKYWQRLSDFAYRNALPQVFRDPEKVLAELSRRDEQIDGLLQRLGKVSTIENAFLLAMGLEFYMMHPALRALFHLMKIFTDECTPEDEYVDHLDALLQGLSRFHPESPELEIAGEATRRFWAQSKELFVQDNIDALTKVLNRRGFFDTITPIINLAQRNQFNVGMMMVDVDHFKKVNDTCGHQRGDEVLGKIASVFRARLRTSDIVGRYGGEEFIICLPSVDPVAVCSLADDLRRLVQVECRYPVPVTVSIGVAQMQIEVRDDNEQTTQLLINQADGALYQAKRNGRNQVVVAEGLF